MEHTLRDHRERLFYCKPIYGLTTEKNYLVRRQLENLRKHEF